MPTLGYWKTRGLAQPIRLLLTYVGEEFEDVMYEQGEAPGFSRESWYSVKPQFGEFLDFPNLPYYLDGDVKITQSNAILKHIARKHKMDGETETERATVDMLLDQQYDFRSGYSDVTYSKHFEDLKDGYIKNVLSQLPLYEKKLGDHPWFVGEKLTVADFCFYELLYVHQRLHPDIFESFPNIRAFLNRFEGLTKVKEYLEKAEVKTLPLNSKIAYFK